MYLVHTYMAEEVVTAPAQTALLYVFRTYVLSPKPVSCPTHGGFAPGGTGRAWTWTQPASREHAAIMLGFVDMSSCHPFFLSPSLILTGWYDRRARIMYAYISYKDLKQAKPLTHPRRLPVLHCPMALTNLLGRLRAGTMILDGLLVSEGLNVVNT